MSNISKIELKNFKFFKDTIPSIDFGGRTHMLLYGENGTGKSSVYWALYTLLEASRKKKADTDKYFSNPKVEANVMSLVNIYSVANDTSPVDSSIKVTNNLNPAKTYELSNANNGIWTDIDLRESRSQCDFISYQDIYEIARLKLGDEPDLGKGFRYAVLPYISCAPFGSRYVQHVITDYGELWQCCKKGMKAFYGIAGSVAPRDGRVAEYDRMVNHFNAQMRLLVDFINRNISSTLFDLGYNFTIKLDYKRPTNIHRDGIYDNFCITMSVVVDGVKIDRPQKFLNEAKLVAIALSIRLVLLQQRPAFLDPDTNPIKFLALDDVMISLDMSNRDALMNLLLRKYTDKYQILFFTHDENLAKFVWTKISLAGQERNWCKKAIFSTANASDGPTIVDDFAMSHKERAEKYLKLCDYNTCALHVRKMFEELLTSKVNLPRRALDGSYISLEEMWKRACQDYPDLGTYKGRFMQSKNMVMNVAAHNQTLSMPVYRKELEDAMKLYTELTTTFIWTKFNIYLQKGMVCEFRHPTQNFSYRFCMRHQMDDNTLDPRVKILTWQFNGTECFDIATGVQDFTDKNKKKFYSEIKIYLKSLPDLAITDDMILDNTHVNAHTFRETGIS